MTEPDGDHTEEQRRAERLAQLEARIAAAKKTREPGPRKDDHHSQAQLAWRMVIELVAGLGIGFGIGYGLDSLFGTMPILLVLFTFLGLAAGIKTMMRSAQEIQAKQVAADAGADDTQAPVETGTQDTQAPVETGTQGNTAQAHGPDADDDRS